MLYKHIGYLLLCRTLLQGRHLRGLGRLSPPPPKEKEKKEKKEKEKKEKKRKKGTIKNDKLLHIKCCFFQFFNCPVALKTKFGPQEKVEMTLLRF